MRRISKRGERRSAAQMHALAAVRREIVLRDDSSARKYLQEFTQAFRSYDAVLSADRLEEQIASADVLLVGDYHALPGSQRYAATMLERLAAKHPVVLAVEAVLSRDQGILDAWWRREIGEHELRKRLRFDHAWGYAWEPFFELLSSARDHAEGAYGLDCMPRNDMRRIRSRDRHATSKLREIRERHPNALLLVVFGESHMAPQHLPQLISQTLPNEKVLTVLQNVDALYWQAVAENAGAVAIGSEAVCVFNSSPLEKYESYRLCLERWNGDEQTDFAPAVYNLIFSLARTLGFRLDSPYNGTQPKYLADALPEVVNVYSNHESADFAGEAARTTLAATEERGCVYVAESNTFFIREFKMQYTAAEAARFLHHACRGMIRERCATTANIENALAYFGARLLCPAVPVSESLPGDHLGESLYAAYLEGRLTKAGARRLFLAHIETAEQVHATLSAVQKIYPNAP